MHPCMQEHVHLDPGLQCVINCQHPPPPSRLAPAPRQSDAHLNSVPLGSPGAEEEEEVGRGVRVRYRESLDAVSTILLPNSFRHSLARPAQRQRRWWHRHQQQRLGKGQKSALLDPQVVLGISTRHDSLCMGSFLPPASLVIVIDSGSSTSTPPAPPFFLSIF